MSDVQEGVKVRKQRVKPVYAFPSYNLGIVLQIADKIEKTGGGKLTEETLAVTLGVSAKSSGFRLRINNARQFSLLTKQGEYLTTTDTAKSILKPTRKDEKVVALKQAFLSIPLFEAVANRFRGQPLPAGDSFRNVLEREFKIESARVRDAERVLLDSAREAGLLTESGGNTYLTTETVQTEQPELRKGSTQYISAPSIGAPDYNVETIHVASTQSSLSTFSEEDIANLNEDEFKQFWEAWGIILRKRAMQQRAIEELKTTNGQVDKDMSENE